MRKSKHLLVVAVLVLLAVAVSAWMLQGRARPSVPQFVGTVACAGCHAQAYALWQGSHHRHAMEAADQKSVLGNFRDARYDYFGNPSRFFTRDGQYFVQTDNAQGKAQTFRIAYTFGYYPLQQYLIAFPDGRMQALGIAWDARPAAAGGQRWFSLYPDRRVTHDDPLHWTGALQNWNSHCAACHSTALERNYSSAENRYETRWQEINVGCEACHGPGSRHVEWANGGRRAQEKDKGLTVRIGKTWESTRARPVSPSATAAMSAQLQVCGLSFAPLGIAATGGHGRLSRQLCARRAAGSAVLSRRADAR